LPIKRVYFSGRSDPKGVRDAWEMDKVSTGGVIYEKKKRR
jgi:hypothetical protein